MAPPENGRSRPVTTQTASQMTMNATTNNTPIVPLADDIVRCTRCSHPLTAPRSVEPEMGPVCRDREVAA
ncbi:MAG TPA: DUF6011 domain-containing protein [Nocardioides sp.]|uniref:DUF6011 domain-containing protein n=1 Tax=uncultured Nocardioides sp. TaxID=198441 RepID=UPI002611FE32|nr:DUF6011 domain-containing protein [uncultured Nocardioides sp.]HRD60939.1 DUF6011 domain-containing protein [Nocardioides sp.]HRI94199.1 DUF6011 domain-containing protein [Nocardioides sp.]HRK44163.1 DUF6011 domain-containing protein [Nocardioides sp.]